MPCTHIWVLARTALDLSLALGLPQSRFYCALHRILH